MWIGFRQLWIWFLTYCLYGHELSSCINGAYFTNLLSDYQVVLIYSVLQLFITGFWVSFSYSSFESYLFRKILSVLLVSMATPSIFLLHIHDWIESFQYQPPYFTSTRESLQIYRSCSKLHESNPRIREAELLLPYCSTVMLSSVTDAKTCILNPGLTLRHF